MTATPTTLGLLAERERWSGYVDALRFAAGLVTSDNGRTQIDAELSLARVRLGEVDRLLDARAEGELSHA